MPRSYKNKQLEGMTFGLYKVVKDTGKKNPRKHPYWETNCTKCGLRKEFLTETLTRNIGTAYCICSPKQKRVRNKSTFMRIETLENPIEDKVHLDYYKPKTRGECCGVQRPCPYVTCKYNLYLDVTDVGSIVINHPSEEPGEGSSESCVLDIADRGGATSEEIGDVLNITQQRVAQIQTDALSKLYRQILRSKSTDILPEGKEIRRKNQDGYITKKEDEEIKAWNDSAVV